MQYYAYIHNIILLFIHTGEAAKVEVVIRSHTLSNMTFSYKTAEVCDGDTVFVECSVEKSAGLIWNLDPPLTSYEASADLPAAFLNLNSPVNFLVSSVSRNTTNIRNSNLSSIAWFSVKEVLNNINDSLALICMDSFETKIDMLTVIKPGNNCTNK